MSFDDIPTKRSLQELVSEFRRPSGFGPAAGPADAIKNVEVLHQEIVSLRERLEGFIEGGSSEERAAGALLEAIQGLGESIAEGQRALGQSIGAQERALQRVEAELFSIRGRLDARAKSVLELPKAGSPSLSLPALRRPDLSGVRRKLAKLRKSPSEFLADSKNPWLRKSSGVVGVLERRWRRG